jgi:CubicO group peptidase (beta-lactamase class C family)
VTRALAAILVGCGALACGGAAPVPPAPEASGLPLVSPAAAGFDSAALARVVEYLRAEVDSGAFPGAVVAVGRPGRLALLAAVGHYAVDDAWPVDPATIYDLASVTKVVGLTSAALLLVSEGRLGLDDPVARWVPAFRGPGKDRVTVRHLLTHASGLPAWRPLFRDARTRDAALALVDSTALLRAPGDTFVYSDLGAIVLTQVVERAAGEPLDRFLDRRVFGPLGMTATRYLPPAPWHHRIAPTEVDTAWRGRLLKGEVHDENAGRLGGVSGHAGLFSNAPDLARFASWLLTIRTDAPADDRGSAAGGGAAGAVRPLPDPALVRAFTTRQGLPAGSTRALGWDTPSDSGYSSAGTAMSRRAFGHTGFTGTSMWIDPERELFVILLTNRVNPTRANTRILQVRPTVADLAVGALRAP